MHYHLREKIQIPIWYQQWISALSLKYSPLFSINFVIAGPIASGSNSKRISVFRMSHIKKDPTLKSPQKQTIIFRFSGCFVYVLRIIFMLVDVEFIKLSSECISFFHRLLYITAVNGQTYLRVLIAILFPQPCSHIRCFPKTFGSFLILFILKCVQNMHQYSGYNLYYIM